MIFKNKYTDRLQYTFRNKRFSIIKNYIEQNKKPIKILDVGGTIDYWKYVNFQASEKCHITILNLFPVNQNIPFIDFEIGDARDLSSFKDKEFDLVFSNSVIEHVGDFFDQKNMAEEIMRVGKNYYVQTPNYWFPIEPHYRVLFFQFLPERTKILWMNKIGVGRKNKIKHYLDAMKEVYHIRLLNKKELNILFPNANLDKEKFIFLTKSFSLHNLKD